MILRILTAIFVAQLALVATLYWPQKEAAPDREALITLIPGDAVNQIQLANGDGATLVLVRHANDWRLDIGLPADSDKVRALLTALLASDPGFPIADSDTAARRFEVSEDNFQRKITLNTADAQGLSLIHI